MLKRLLFFILTNFIVQSQTLSVKVLNEEDIKKFTIIDESIVHTGTDAHIRKVTDGTKLYILKQIRNPLLDEQFLLINDVIASTIGCQADININEVFFVPYNIASNLKFYPDRAATLHSYVSGKDLEQEFYKALPQDFTLHQRVINHGSYWQNKYPIGINQQGMTKAVIESMCFHSNLPAIVALDTFVGNSDRSEPNIFYDKNNNRFCGIDQAAALSKKLSSLAFERISELAQEGYFQNCSSEIRAGLFLYRDKLLQLKNNVHYSVTIEAMKKLALLLNQNSSLNTDIEERIQAQESIIKHNYQFVLEIINLLDQVLKLRS